MKKTNFDRLVAVVLALVMMLSIFAGCANNQEMPEQFGGKNQTTQTTENTEVTTDDVMEERIKALEEQIKALQAENEALKKGETTETTDSMEEMEEMMVEKLDANTIKTEFDYVLSELREVDAKGRVSLRAITHREDLIEVELYDDRDPEKEMENKMRLPIKGASISIYLEEKIRAGLPHTHENGEWAIAVGEELVCGHPLVLKDKDGVEYEYINARIVALPAEDADDADGYIFYLLVEECVHKAPVRWYPSVQQKPEKEEPEEVPEVEQEPEKEPEKDPEKPNRPGGGGGGYHPEDPEDPDEPQGTPQHNPEHNEQEFDEGTEGTTPGHSDVVYDPENQDEIPDLTTNPTDNRNNIIGNVEAGQEAIPDLTTNPTDPRNDINTRENTTTTVTDQSVDSSNYGNTANVHSGQVFDD